jgi:hypothetical protein
MQRSWQMITGKEDDLNSVIPSPEKYNKTLNLLPIILFCREIYQKRGKNDWR